MSCNIEPFLQLGDYLRTNPLPQHILDEAGKQNRWFSESNITRAAHSIAWELLDGDKIANWISPHKNRILCYRKIALILSGNIPMVGFFDIMCCSIVGCDLYVKLSSKDRVLMEYIISLLRRFGVNNIYEYNSSVQIDAVIATGSNNANRYFEHTFENIPSLLRSDRHSIALIDGTENEVELSALWDDVFIYYGLGCRNVSEIFVPTGYDLSLLQSVWERKTINLPAFINGIRQQRAIKTMIGVDFEDGKYYLLSSSATYSDCLGDIILHSYSNKEEIEQYIKQENNNLQCVVGHGFIPFGQAQQPTLNDWADGVNVFDFLFVK